MGFLIALIPGDGVGPELVNASKKIIGKLVETYKLDINVTEVEAGDSALAKYGSALPQQTLNVIDKADAILKGPVGESAMDVVVKLRQMYDMYANIRPAKSLPNVQSKFQDVDILIVRENTEDLYKGFEYMASDDVAIGMKVITRKASERIARVGLEYARKRNRKVTCVHKANVMRVTDGLFAKVCREVIKGKDVEYSEMYVDAAAANLVRNPNMFDVIVTTNVYGDILSDEAAQIAGSLGLAPSANIGDKKALFEPVHGAAFDIAGKDIANPTAFLLSLAMLLEYLYDRSKEKKYLDASRSLTESILSVYKEGTHLTPDIGGTEKLSGMADVIYRRIT
ncbi:MAG: isopropylmalate/isohomocitrate dehydrogenase [Candidatus Aramenus sulfurataquae]|jgi:3-isopropylmalate dehydrogenase|uniref:3-isopropylmalate dehydrogenase n=2 Tax=Candidatus Aramenus sulfurataquae TaxID=1326980 RepID=W7KVL9_9CREN|nr:MAG: isopropylmalate/isohomocitrate dehydrogenase [Candidatus Aramenus sulfurataquae]MBW9140583.1 3-isopropylmalate dehydrogenase [Candidatus Aramenus sp.]MCL7343319.1 isocitrate/isopropylmalate family dehydrogenase [Candidatus Aramenus sulfurataquae]